MSGNRAAGSLVVTCEIDSLAPDVAIQRPREGSLYIGGREIVKGVLRETVIIGNITFDVEATDGESGIDRVDFYLDDELRSSVSHSPFEWPLDDPLRGRHSVHGEGYDWGGTTAEDERDFLIFNR